MNYTYNTIKEKIIEINEEKIKAIIKENLLGILENCVNNNKRSVKICQRTMILRQGYYAECKYNRDKIVNMIKQIKLFRENLCVSDKHKEYVKEIEIYAIYAIWHLIMDEWMNIKEDKIINKAVKSKIENIENIEFWANEVYKKWEEIINDLKNKEGSNGKTLNAGEICIMIETWLYYEYEIRHINQFYGYFTHPEYKFNIKEDEYEEDEEELCGESYADWKQKYTVAYFGEIDKKEYFKIPIERYKLVWILYYRFFADASVYFSEKVNRLNENYPFYEACIRYKDIKCHNISRKEYENIVTFEQFLDGFMISMIALEFGILKAYIWGVENWIKAKVDIETKGFRTHIIDRISRSSEITKQWLLFSLLDKLVADDLTIAEQYSVNTKEITRHCVNGNDILERNVKDILQRTKIIYLVINKQVRKCDNVNEVSNLYDEKREYWTVYGHQKLCLDYLLDDNDGKSRILFLRKSSCTRKNQSFPEIKRYFMEIFQYDKSKQETYMVIYYLNQFVHFDSAVELIYGISKVMEITRNTAKSLKEEIVNLANEVVRLQKIIKCGTGMVIYEYFKEKWVQLKDGEEYSEDDCKLFLQELTEVIKNYLKREKIKGLQDYFYQNLLQTSWNLIDDNIFEGCAEIDFRQNYCLGLKRCINKSTYSKEVKEKYISRLRKTLYDDNIYQIKEMIGKEFKSVQKEIFGEEFNSALKEMSGEELKLALKVMLKISDEAWQDVSQSFEGIQCDYNSRDKISMLYKVIQNALINANYQD